MSTKLNKIYNEDCIQGLKKIPDNCIDLIITSPPYNVDIKYDVYSDSLPYTDYMNFTLKWLKECYRILKPDGRICINVPIEANFQKNGGRVCLHSEYWQLMKLIGFKWAGQVDLIEDNPQIFKLSAWGSWLSPSAPYVYNPKECILVSYKQDWKKQNKGASYFNDSNKKEFIELVRGYWKYKAETKKLTEANFSLDIPLNCLKIFSYENDIVLDPFMGAGTTAVACKMLKRNYIGFEISKGYCDIAEKRINEIL